MSMERGREGQRGGGRVGGRKKRRKGERGSKQASEGAQNRLMIVHHSPMFPSLFSISIPRMWVFPNIFSIRILIYWLTEISLLLLRNSKCTVGCKELEQQKLQNTLYGFCKAASLLWNCLKRKSLYSFLFREKRFTVFWRDILCQWVQANLEREFLSLILFLGT